MRRKKHEKWGLSGEKWRLSYVFAIFAHERLPNYHADFTIRLAVNSSKQERRMIYTIIIDTNIMQKAIYMAFTVDDSFCVPTQLIIIVPALRTIRMVSGKMCA